MKPAERGNVLPAHLPLQPGESRGTGWAETLSNLAKRLRAEVEGPLWGAFFFMAAPHVLALVLWAGTLIAPFAHVLLVQVLLVQVLVPLVIALVFAPEATRRRPRLRPPGARE